MRFWLIFLMVLGSIVPAHAEFQDPELQGFLRDAVLEALRSERPPSSEVSLALQKDEAGRFRSFLPGCPICQAVTQAFEAYLPEAPPAGASRFPGETPLARTRAVSRFVQEVLDRKMASLDQAQREGWENRLRAAAEVGTEALARLQSQGVQTYERMWSCQMCDAAARAGKPR